MKVLFAVSNENISGSIIKKYQEQHKEIISGKNVYYFNAIIKELQKDKSYDRIVISEDLEPFANNNYDTIDKFLFDKLDSISDEAANFVGSDIPIIFICSDRRTKSEPLLVKLFGIGIYSALIGNDRSIDKVCELLNKPRTKKEAKNYYKIDSDDVEYKAENEGEVSETEIQNILTHYKRLGKNEEKYVESFNSIVSQYTDEQLKIIIRALPLNVKAVLEEKSDKYQKLMTFADIHTGTSGKKKSSYEKDKRKKETGRGELIEKQLGRQTMSKPVIIPSTVSTSRARKVETTTTQSLGKSLKESKMGQSANYIPAKERMQRKTTTQSLGQMHAAERMERLDPNRTTTFSREHRMHQAVPSTPVKVEAPAKTPQKQRQLVEPVAQAAPVAEPPVVKRRGRPRKVVEEPVIEKTAVEKQVTETPIVEEVPTQKTSIETTVEPPKRRGRPRKNPEPTPEPIPEPTIEEVAPVQETIKPAQEIAEPMLVQEVAPMPEVENTVTSAPRKRRGRPRKNIEPAISEMISPEPQEESVNLFALDEDEEEMAPQTVSYDNRYYEEGTRSAYQEEEPTILPGFEDEEEEYFDQIEQTQQPISTRKNDYYYEPENEATLPGLEEYEKENDDFLLENNQTQAIESTRPYGNTTANLDYLLAGDKKIVAFVGTSKNGTSFLVNNVAELLSEKGIKTAILDTTKNKNAYYIYTENEESLRQTAFQSIKELTRGNARGIAVNKNLDVYTTIPENDEDLIECGRILETLAQNYTAVLIDCDFETEYGYFSLAQEIYLVQSMDILTIQPLTAFLTDLKAKGILQPEKLRVVLNKYLRVRGVTEKVIIGGMAFYNDPTMSVMTELFNKDTVKYCVISFDEQVYSKYLEGLVECKISTRNYTKKFLAEMVKLREMVYPLMEKNSPKYGNYKDSGFSSNMNHTLTKMKKSRY